MGENKRFARFLMSVFILTGMLGGVLVASPTIAATDNDSVATIVGADGTILTDNITDENFRTNSGASAAEPVENNAKANDPSAAVSGDTAKKLEAQAKIIREIQELRIERAALQKRLAEQDEKIAQLTKALEELLHE